MIYRLRRVLVGCLLVSLTLGVLLALSGKAKADPPSPKLACPRVVTWTDDDAEAGVAPPGGDTAIAASWTGIATARHVDAEAQVTYHWVAALAGETGTSGVTRDGRSVLVTLDDADEGRSPSSLRTVLTRYARQARRALCVAPKPLSSASPTRSDTPPRASAVGAPLSAPQHPGWGGNPVHAAAVTVACLLALLLLVWWVAGTRLLAVRGVLARLADLRRDRNGTDDDPAGGES